MRKECQLFNNHIKCHKIYFKSDSCLNYSHARSVKKIQGGKENHEYGVKNYYQPSTPYVSKLGRNYICQILLRRCDNVIAAV